MFSKSKISCQHRADVRDVQAAKQRFLGTNPPAVVPKDFPQIGKSGENPIFAQQNYVCGRQKVIPNGMHHASSTRSVATINISMATTPLAAHRP
jgi:hypothetical protein